MRKIIAGILVLFVATITLPSVVGAVTDTTQSSTGTNQATDSQKNTVDDKVAARKKRIEEYRANLANKLSKNEEERLAKRCEAAQAKVSSLSTRVEEAIAKRTARYNEISTKLATLLEKLTAAGVDTVSIETAIAEYNTQVTAVDTAVNSYLDTLSDLVSMDCVNDPSGFKAALEAARTNVGAIIAESNKVKNSAVPAIKDALQVIRKSLSSGNN